MTDAIDDLALQLERDLAHRRATHAQLFWQFPTAGFVPPDCNGVIAAEWSRPDTDREGRRRVVTLFRCERCGTLVSLDCTGRRILNAYQVPDLVARLARDLDAKRGV